MRYWLAFYLANWYGLAMSGWLLSQPLAWTNWLAELPWTSWGTEIAQGLTDGETVSGGALWILVGAILVSAGVLGSLMASVVWLARQAAAHEQSAPSPAPLPQAPRAGTLSEQAQQAAELVDDPQVRDLIRRLNTRLG